MQVGEKTDEGFTGLFVFFLLLLFHLQFDVIIYLLC